MWNPNSEIFFVQKLSSFYFDPFSKLYAIYVKVFIVYPPSERKSYKILSHPSKQNYKLQATTR